MVVVKEASEGIICGGGQSSKLINLVSILYYPVPSQINAEMDMEKELNHWFIRSRLSCKSADQLFLLK
jgi:hypothetical protein